MKKAEIPCPEVVLLRKHILVMSFIGKDAAPAPKIKDARLGAEDLRNAYHQVLHVGTLDQVCRREQAPQLHLRSPVSADDAAAV